MAAARTEGGPGTGFDPAFVLTAVMTPATAWSAAGPFGPALTPHPADDPAALRASISRAVALMTGAGPGDA
jgi:hypothetical protein